MDVFLHVDLPLLTVAILSSFLCSLLGGFLVLRRQALIGDALSHAILPGLAAGFMLSGRIEPLTMGLGALGAVVMAIVSIGFLERRRIERGAAMGVVFTVFFALGVVLLEKGVGPEVHLDAQHALFGALETVVWVDPPPLVLEAWLDWQVWSTLPPQIKLLLGLALLESAMVMIFYRSLVAATFDSGLARCQGLWIRVLDQGFLLAVGIVAVGVFEIVGSILVIAMFVCPAAAARVLARRLSSYLGLTLVFGVSSGILGYVGAVWAPIWLGFDRSLAVAGMIAVMAGVFQLVAMGVSRRYPD